jgi:hypothetical protein
MSGKDRFGRRFQNGLPRHIDGERDHRGSLRARNELP